MPESTAHTRSANKAHIISCFVCVTAVFLKYTDIVYSVVSVEPSITAAVRAVILFAPKLDIISESMPREPLPETGRMNASTIVPCGIPTFFAIGATAFVITSSSPD